MKSTPTVLTQSKYRHGSNHQLRTTAENNVYVLLLTKRKIIHCTRASPIILATVLWCAVGPRCIVKMGKDIHVLAVLKTVWLRNRFYEAKSCLASSINVNKQSSITVSLFLSVLFSWYYLQWRSFH